jgi:hypothetical protein
MTKSCATFDVKPYDVVTNRDMFPIGTACTYSTTNGQDYLHAGCTTAEPYIPKWWPYSKITDARFLVVDGEHGGCRIDPTKYVRPKVIASLGPCLQAGGYQVEGFGRVDAADSQQCAWDPSLPGADQVKTGDCRDKHMTFKNGNPNYQDIVVLKDWANKICNASLTPPPGKLFSSVADVDCEAIPYGPGCPNCADPFNLLSTCFCNKSSTRYNAYSEVCDQIIDQECSKNPKKPLCPRPTNAEGKVIDPEAISCESPDPIELDGSCLCNPLNSEFPKYKNFCIAQAKVVGIDFAEHALWLGYDVNTERFVTPVKRPDMIQLDCEINPKGPGCTICKDWTSLDPSCVCYPTNQYYPTYKDSCEVAKNSDVDYQKQLAGIKVKKPDSIITETGAPPTLKEQVTDYFTSTTLNTNSYQISGKTVNNGAIVGGGFVILLIVIIILVVLLSPKSRPVPPPRPIFVPFPPPFRK